MNETQSEPIRVLIVEDEIIPANYLKGIIEEDGVFRVEGIVPGAAEAREAIGRIAPQIVFMDIMIEGPISGAELALRIRRDHPEILIVFLTAYSQEEMIEYAAEAEAFAYLLKPYRPREIHATLKLAASRLRRPTRKATDGWIELIDGYRCRVEPLELRREGAAVPLSPREAGLIQILCAQPGRVVSTETILERLELSDASLRSLIYRLRKATDERLIESVKRYGYRIGTR